MSNAAVIRAFGDAAARYEESAEPQRRIAESLSQHIAALPLPASPKVLEIGCGTGFLSRAVMSRLKVGHWIATDIASAMVARARAALPPTTQCLVMDGEAACFSPDAGFDLICANLAIQWFRDPATSFDKLTKLLRPGGYLVFSTLGNESFREWRALLQQHNLTPGTRQYPTAKAWASFLPVADETKVTEQHLTVRHEDAFAYLKDLKRIGAATPRPGYLPLRSGQLRQILRGVASPFDVTYHVVIVRYRAPT